MYILPYQSGLIWLCIGPGHGDGRCLELLFPVRLARSRAGMLRQLCYCYPALNLSY